MEVKGRESLKTTRVTEWTLNQGGYLPISFGAFLIVGCVLAYVIAVLRGHVDPFLPLISDAAGSPPQNGLFGTLVCIGGILGVFFMFLRYLIVIEQNLEKSKAVDGLNKISLAVGIASMCGITLITGYPANFYRDREVWLNHVGIPHMMGGVLLFALGLVYIAMQCILTLYLRSNLRFMLFLRVCLCLAATAAFVHHVVTVPDNFGGIAIQNNSSMPDTNNSATEIPTQYYKLHIDMGGSYIPSAVSQWLLMILFSCFFFTFFGEVQEYSLLIVIETSDPDLDVNGDVAGDDYGDRDGPSTYRRKTSHAYSSFPTGISYDAAAAGARKNSAALGMRRDSSCQTKDEMFPKDNTLTNGSRKTTDKLNLPAAEVPSESAKNGVKEHKNGLNRQISEAKDGNENSNNANEKKTETEES